MLGQSRGLLGGKPTETLFNFMPYVCLAHEHVTYDGIPDRLRVADCSALAI